MSVPVYLPYYVLGGSIGIVAAILIGLNQALVRAGWPESERASAMQGVGGTLLGFLVFAVVLASLEVYRTTPDQLPVIPLGILLPILVGGILLQRSHLLQRVIDAVPQSWLVAIQFYRALGVIFLILYASNKLPGLFAWPAGVGDIAVGLLAPTVALAYARDPERGHGKVLWWNVLGIADLIVAVGTGFLTAPSPFQLFAFDRPSELITAFPLVVVPTFLVPLSILLHLVSLTKLRQAMSRTSPQNASGAPA